MTMKSVLSVALGSESEGMVHIGNFMRDYLCTKEVKAARIIAIGRVDDGMDITIADPMDESIHAPYSLTLDMITRYTPTVGDYLVLYSDDYVSVSPKDVFESGYIMFGEMEPQTKVEKSHIDALVASLEFKFARVEDTTVTGCWAYLPNGFKVGYGESACVDPNNFNEADGQKYAKERCIQNATNKLWELEGYLLKVTGATSNPSNCFDEEEIQSKESNRPGFRLYESKPTIREAYQIRADDFFEPLVGSSELSDRMKINIGGIEYIFAYHEPVKAGDYVVFLTESDIYHCNQEVFVERNII
ncbi:Gp49 family protein [Vibrio sp. HA2012]|uniref:Gp49 family protein n=1 Tax=Vibrio sp. HA2012 TaxID=1971595 RepID=UPI001E590CF9|nr:Gp49 family protein [Vibrio sp. HA2012]